MPKSVPPKSSFRSNCEHPTLNDGFTYCHLCQDFAFTKHGFTRHVKKYHLTIKDHNCPFCGKSGINKRDMKLHIQKIHKEDPNAIISVPKDANKDEILSLIARCFPERNSMNKNTNPSPVEPKMETPKIQPAPYVISYPIHNPYADIDHPQIPNSPIVQQFPMAYNLVNQNAMAYNLMNPQNLQNPNFVDPNSPFQLYQQNPSFFFYPYPPTSHF